MNQSMLNDLDNLASRETVFREGLLAGRVTIVTGGAGGIGRAIATLFARLGAQVVLAGRTEARLAEIAAAISDRTVGTVTYHRADIRDPDTVDALIAFTHDRFGRIDIVVNNGGGQFAQDAIDISRKGWRAVIDINLNGTWWMMQAAAQYWRDRAAAGNLINIIMPVARGIPQMVHATAARAGILHASKTVSTEWAPMRIRVNCIAPGTIASDGMENYDPLEVARLHRTNPSGIMGEPWDIALGAAYLAVPDTSRFITGEVLTIDGGLQQWGTTWPAGMPERFRQE
jgi:citronellol/citronellal dehydrogenase